MLRTVPAASPKAMLLSVERPFVGAFAFHIPRATLLHFMVWCKQSCRRRLNMCKRAIGTLQELGRSCRFLNEIPAGEPGYQLQALAAHSSGGERT
jgi:hypothetical protein